jgi:hypothetical protein
LTDVTRSVCPEPLMPAPPEPLVPALVPEPLVPEPLVPEAVVPEVPEPLVPERDEPLIPLPSQRPVTWTLWPTCACRFLPISMMSPDDPDADVDPAPEVPDAELPLVFDTFVSM